LGVETVIGGHELTVRQGEVLDAALRLLVRAGDKLTMAAVAREASCSKETLYKWFGDRDGLLTATVQWQAAKVRMPQIDKARLDAASLRAGIEQFGHDYLAVLSSETSVALNRIAVSHAGSRASDLGAIVLQNGRRTMGARLKPVLEAGRDAGLLAFENSEVAFQTFFGLVVRDVQIRLLLGEELQLSAEAVALDARRAAQQFLALYGAEKSGGNA
jgi:AcrR family transcriptional regulator